MANRDRGRREVLILQGRRKGDGEDRQSLWIDNGKKGDGEDKQSCGYTMEEANQWGMRQSREKIVVDKTKALGKRWEWKPDKTMEKTKESMRKTKKRKQGKDKEKKAGGRQRESQRCGH